MRFPIHRQFRPMHRFRRAAAAVLSFGCCCLAGLVCTAELRLEDQPHLRRPVAGAWLEESKLLATANQRSGSISVVDIQKRIVLSEVAVGESLVDVAAIPTGGWLLAVDAEAHELVVMQWEADELQIRERVPVSHYPVNVAVSPDGSRCTVASQWSRTITTFGIEPAEDRASLTLTKLDELPLSFAPGGQLFLPDGEHVLVTDAFTGQMALLDVASQRVSKIPGRHIVRIYGMALSTEPGGLYVGHQTAMRRSREMRGDAVTPARAMANFVGEYSIPGLLKGRLQRFISEGATRASSGYFTGDLRQMAELAPAMLTVTTPNGRHQVLNPAADQLVVIRRFWDDIVVSDPDNPTKRTSIRLGPTGPLTLADRGEALFYDTSLSVNGWMSCHSCHPDGHTTGQLADTLGDGSRRTHKRVLTLLGSGETGKWAWSGKARSLHGQIHKSLKTTLGKPSSPQVARAIAAFVESLPPPPPLQPASDDPEDKAQLARGEALFTDLGCADCHVPEQNYTSNATYDVGLRDEKGMSKFNPPSLRGVSQGYSFLHDGRAKELREVFVTHRHPYDEVLPDDELADLLRFLSSL